MERRPMSAVAVAQVPASTASWRIGVTLFAVAAAATLALMATRASGQQANFPYDSIEMHEALQDETRVRQIHTRTKNYANSGEGNAAVVNGYFAYYVPAKITAPDGVKHISELMSEARTLLSRAELAGRTQVVQTLTQYLYEGMRKVAEGNHHPSARINAVLLLSELNRRPANNQARTAPVPLAQVWPILLKLYQDENNPDGVRAAALQGMRRHVMYGFPQIPDNDRATVTNLMTQLLESEAPENRPAAAHAYLQRFAVDILETLRPEEDKSLAVKLVSVSTKPENPDLIALYSAARLGNMAEDLKGQVQNPEKVLESWNRRLLTAFENEVARIEGLERPTPRVQQPADPSTFLQKTTTDETSRSRSMMSGEMMDGMDDAMMEAEMMESEMMDGMEGEMMEGMDMDMMMMMGGGVGITAKPQPPEVRSSRMQLNTVLQHLKLGVTGSVKPGKPKTPGGLLASVSDEQKAVVEEWITSMDPIITALNDPMLDSRQKYLDGLKEQVDLLKEIVGEPVDEDDQLGGGLPPELQPVDEEQAEPENAEENTEEDAEQNAIEELGVVGQ